MEKIKDIIKTKKVLVIVLASILIIGATGTGVYLYNDKSEEKTVEKTKEKTETVEIEIIENAGDKFVVTKEGQFIIGGISSDTVEEFKITGLVIKDGKIIKYINEEGKTLDIKDLGLQEVQITENTIQDVESGEVAIEPETKVDESGNVVASKPIGGNTSGNASGSTNNGNTGSTSGSGSSSNKPSAGGSGSTGGSSGGNTGGSSSGNTGGNTGGSSSGGGTTVTPPVKYGFFCEYDGGTYDSGRIYNTYSAANDASYYWFKANTHLTDASCNPY